MLSRRRLRVPRELWIDFDELRRVESIAEARLPNETGGILVGARSSDRLWVLAALEVSDNRPRPNSYRLATRSANRVLDNFLRDTGLEDSPFGYIGSWHSHPRLTGPSLIDYKTIRYDNDCQDKAVAMLVIARSAARCMSASAVIAHKGRARSARVVTYPDTRLQAG